MERPKYIQEGQYWYALRYSGSGKYFFVYQYKDGKDIDVAKYAFHQETQMKQFIKEQNGW